MRATSRSLRGLSLVATASLAVLVGAAGNHASAQVQESSSDQKARPPLVIAKQGNFFVGGHYNEDGEVVGQMYVEYQIPHNRTHRYPMVFIPGGGQIGAGWWRTPDGREGWAQYFLRRGYAVYVVDVPARGRSAYNSDLGPLSDPFDTLGAQQLWAAPERFNLWPASQLHTQWVGPAVTGDATFDQFMRSQSDWLPLANNDDQERLTAAALVRLLDRIGPAILVPHSQPGSPSWLVADRRPNLVKGLVQLEPGGPPVFFLAPLFPAVELPWGLTYNRITYDPTVSDPSELNFAQVPVTDPYVETCWVQAEPARELPNLQRVPILLLTSESGYNTLWDPCTHEYLKQAGVEHTWIRLEKIGIHGNGHFHFIERNSDRVAGVVRDWIKDHVKGDRDQDRQAVADR
jgi:pimeloyl-ACP methyl ester carboxylesterase